MGDLYKYDPRYTPLPFGLHNSGVICHLNALLQSLLSCPAVIRAALENEPYLQATQTGRAFFGAVSAAVRASSAQDTAGRLGSAQDAANSSAALLAALTADLRRRRPKTAYGPRQESASEGLVLLLDMLDAPKAAPARVNPISRLFYHRYVTAVVCEVCGHRSSTEEDLAVQFNLFDYDALRDPPTTPRDLGELLYCEKTKPHGYRCEGCKSVGRCARLRYLQMVPEVLVILFNIYTEQNRRSRAIPDKIQFRAAAGVPLVYRRVAQVFHEGGLGGGHYTAKGLRRDGAVYMFNDASVSKSSFGASPAVYMTFYHAV